MTIENRCFQSQGITFRRPSAGVDVGGCKPGLQQQRSTGGARLKTWTPGWVVMLLHNSAPAPACCPWLCHTLYSGCEACTLLLLWPGFTEHQSGTDWRWLGLLKAGEQRQDQTCCLCLLLYTHTHVKVLREIDIFGVAARYWFSITCSIFLFINWAF